MSNCVFARRRTLPVKLPTLVELFSTAAICTYIRGTTTNYIGGQNRAPAIATYITRNANISNATNADNVYLIVFFNGYISFWKCTSTTAPVTVNTTPILKSSSSYAGITANGSTANYYYYSGGYSDSASGTSVNGATMAVIKFSNDYTADQINAVLSSATVTRCAGRNSDTDSEVRTNNKTCAVYLTAKDQTISWWTSNGSTWTITNYATANSGSAPTVSSGYLTLGSTKSGTIIGLS